MAPPGIKYILHKRPEDHGLWYPHALSGCYIRPSLEHYWWHNIWIHATNSVFIEQTVSWFPHKTTIPTSTVTYIIITTAKYLNAALKQINKNPLLRPYDTITRKAPFQLNPIFSNASSVLKSQQYPITPKPVAEPPRVSLSTTQHFCNISPTTKNISEIFEPPNPNFANF